MALMMEALDIKRCVDYEKQELVYKDMGRKLRKKMSVISNEVNKNPEARA